MLSENGVSFSFVNDEALDEWLAGKLWREGPGLVEHPLESFEGRTRLVEPVASAHVGVDAWEPDLQDVLSTPVGVFEGQFELLPVFVMETVVIQAHRVSPG